MSSSADQSQRAEAAPASAGASEQTAASSKPELPPLTPAEFRAYNRLAEHMDYFHEHFRRSWAILYSAASTGKRPAGMSMKQLLDEGLSLIKYLETHHGIEESFFFPILARKMPQFRATGGKSELLKQHQQIHAGMDLLEDYIRKVKNRETELDMSVLKEKMDSWGEVLHKHLDQEVETLGAENMRKYWTMDEIRTIPI